MVQSFLMTVELPSTIHSSTLARAWTRRFPGLSLLSAPQELEADVQGGSLFGDI